MRISVRRTGGFAGIARTWEIDTATLPPDRAVEIERLARALRAGRATTPDAFGYEVTIDGETTIVEDAAALVDAIVTPAPTP